MRNVFRKLLVCICVLLIAPAGHAASNKKNTLSANPPESIKLFDLISRPVILKEYKLNPKALQAFCPEDSKPAALHKAILSADVKFVDLPGCTFKNQGYLFFRSFDFDTGEHVDFGFKDTEQNSMSIDQAEVLLWQLNEKYSASFNAFIKPEIEKHRKYRDGFIASKNLEFYERCNKNLTKKTNVLNELKKWGIIDLPAVQICDVAVDLNIEALPACLVASFEMCREHPASRTNSSGCYQLFANGQWMANPKARKAF